MRRHPLGTWSRLLVAVALLLPGLARAEEQAAKREVVLWHGYRAAEEDALTALARRFEAEHPGVAIRLLGLPYDAFASKLTSAVPRGNGPDLFIFAHERIGSWSRSGVVAPIDRAKVSLDFSSFLSPTLDALTYEGRTYGLPLAFKSTVLFYNKALVPQPPRTTDQLLEIARRLTDADTEAYGLAYPTDDPYFHAAWMFGFGGRIFDEDGQPRIDRPESAAALQFVQDLVIKEQVVPQEATYALVTRLFNEGKAAMVINGPWFLGEIQDGVDFGIAVLPEVSATGQPARPFLTVEAIMLAERAKEPELALEFAAFLAAEGAVLRATEGRQAVAWEPAYLDPALEHDTVLASFRAQLPNTVPTDSRPLMQTFWEPSKGALKSVLRGTEPAVALERAESRLRASIRPAPESANPTVYLILIGLLGLVGTGAWMRRVQKQIPHGTSLRREIGRNKAAYAYLGPAFAGMLFLVLAPFAVGVAIGFTHHEAGEFSFVGLANFKDILFSQSYGPTDPLSFYFTLVVTVMWTVANIVLHVGIGLALALLLKEPWLQLKGVYRALLVIPWAVPNYITALIWKGMFHKQFGAINGVLAWFGLEPVGWFSNFWTAFTANVVTNTWLGFPFMMVVALGALQSIPGDLYEAAEVDGASRWQQFKTITVPLLKPAMLPAVILGMVWTFNMFNIVYLVSGGEPDGGTDILISEAYRWAFQRQEQYGYAAAYATLIFCILVAYTLGTRKLAGGEEVA